MKFISGVFKLNHGAKQNLAIVINFEEEPSFHFQISFHTTLQAKYLPKEYYYSSINVLVKSDSNQLSKWRPCDDDINRLSEMRLINSRKFDSTLEIIQYSNNHFGYVFASYHLHSKRV